MSPSSSTTSPSPHPLPSSSSPLLTMSLGLDDNTDHPRRFLSWPSTESRQEVLTTKKNYKKTSVQQNQPYLMAYGGDDGTLTMLVNTTTTNNSNTSKTTTTKKWIPVRRWDDAIRAVAISPDGKRVAVGFETGAITVYAYDHYHHSNDNSEKEELAPPHPFVQAAWRKWKQRQENANKDATMDNDNDDDEDGLLSQSIDHHLDDDDDNNNEHSFPGPTMSAPIRDLQFDPRCAGGGSNGSKNCYYLAIASEAGFCISNVATPQTLLPLYLHEASEKEHDASGIRGLAYFQSTSSTTTTTAASPSLWLLATLAMDGRLCVWNVTSSNNDPELDWELYHRDPFKSIVQPDVGELNGATAADRSCRLLVLTTSGGGNGGASASFLALPGQTDVVLRPTATSTLQPQRFLPSLNGKGHIEPIVAMTMMMGQYLITTGRDGRVNLWELPSRNRENDDQDDNSSGTFVAQIGHYESVPTDLFWCPSLKQHQQQQRGGLGDDTLFIACANGTCATVANLNQFIPKEVEEEEDVQDNVGLAATKTTTSKKDKPTAKPRSIPQEATVSSQNKNVYVEDEAQDDDDDDAGIPEAHREDDNDDNGNDDDTVELVDALQNGSNQAKVNQHVSDAPGHQANIGNYDDDDEDDDEDDDQLDHPMQRNVLSRPLPDPQAAFAPSSTPLDLFRRILCWNYMGVISLLRGDDGLVRNMVNIDFTDVTSRRPMSFTDNMNFILGSLGDQGAIFATDLQDDTDDDDDLESDLVDGLQISERTKAMVKKTQRQRMRKDANLNSTGSSIYFHRFATFASLRDKDWYWSLPDGERVLGCACGDGWAAVATSRRFLRFFSPGGNQGQVLWLKGEVVMMVGRSRFVAVIYHESNPLMDGTQQLGYLLMDAVSCRIVSQGSVSCISKQSSLSWAGFSNDYSLMVMDTDGMLSMLICIADGSAAGSNAMMTTPSSWEWVPILDTVGLKKSAEDCFWPIAVQDGKLVCVPLKGGNQFPDATRRPVTTTLNLRMPLARGGTTDKTNLEELSVRANVALNQKRVMSDITIMDPAEKEAFEDEYQAMCAQVDKVTLQLYMATLKTGKLERALDLVQRLHLEQSFDIAITVADQMNHRNLSDRIEVVKERWLSLKLADQHEEEGEPVEGDYDDDIVETEEEDPFDNNHDRNDVRTDGSDRKEATENASRAPVRRISPDTSRTKKRSFGQVEDDDSTTNNKRLQKNPFAKKCLESPAPNKSILPLNSPPRLPSPKPKISRMSTFSTKSREQNKASKNIL